ncbi:polysaccharide deacetylase [Pseudonocardia dioxanivorans CB1190]|uniref:Polysaccharide deacetylase n=1 Tax=Pseudonocardia dioxanivorans (strain ATCC 55486 / DSM 44775 / JCM 13855 / CB1190) TaxID=675635 RepID=F4CQ25_PSEUX|nr:polysaccharide deacetylase family protein [Pseudonocardia dioxanivorans]AEA27221.1 polysaccharide deacetylase [Pseudonocardia dioxanivorans CB1190]
MTTHDGVRMPRRRLLRLGAGLAGLAGVAAACGTAPSEPAPAPPPSGIPPSAPPTTRPSAVPGAPAAEVERRTGGRPEVALTFHGAGDPGLAKKVLTALHDRGAAVTVLAVGTWLQQSPDSARTVTDLGHELGNHTWSHLDVDALPEAAARTEIEKCRDRIAALTGGPGAFFRPSQAQHATARVRVLAAAAGYPTVLSYDVDSRDFTDPGVDAIRRNVRSATAGSVVSMHLGHPETLQAIPGLLDDLAARGLRPVTATQLFA